MDVTLTTTEKRTLPLDMERVNAYVSKWKPYTAIEISITKRQPRKSKALQGYYFAGVLPKICEAVGYEPEDEEEVHRSLKIKYFKIKEDGRGICQSIPHVFANESDLAVPDKVKFVEWVIRKAAEYGVYIEDPK